MKILPSNKSPILVVDDDEGLLLSIRATLLSSGMPEPALVSDSRRVMKMVKDNRYQLVLLDLMMPGLSGMDVLQQLKEESPDVECVIITAVDEVSSAVEAMKFGAYDYLVKPLDNEKLVIVINRALERYSLRHKLTLFESPQIFSDLKHPTAFQDMVAEDEAMALVFRQVEAAAVTDYSIIISGESGTGKEMLARIIHRLSDRSGNRFLAVNMAASSKTLFEDEFFGHTKGAYTGALEEKRGFFEAAQGGTLFLDELTELELSLQGKLLRVIQEKELYRLGSSEARNVDARIIAATNRDIQKEIRQGRFRADLYYRLNVCHINVPPLRKRKKDILPLARYFLAKHAAKNKKDVVSLAPDLAERLSEHPFPGNVRELENIIASAVLMEKGKVLVLSSTRDLVASSGPFRQDAEELPPLAELEKRHIYRVLKATGGNRIRAAKVLGIGLRTLQRKLKVFSYPPTAS